MLRTSLLTLVLASFVLSLAGCSGEPTYAQPTDRGTKLSPIKGGAQGKGNVAPVAKD